MDTFQIQLSTITDIPEILNRYDEASAYQKSVFPENIWPLFEENLVRNEVVEQRQFKLIHDGKIVCVWAITFDDPEIWPDATANDSLFIHRIATHPCYRGLNFVKRIVEWAKNYAKNHNKSYIRMDTCGVNNRLINYYQHCGFNFLGIKKLTQTTNLPSHYHNAPVCYFEIDLRNNQRD